MKKAIENTQPKEKVTNLEQLVLIIIKKKPNEKGKEVKGGESHLGASDSLRSHELYSPWNSPDQNTGVGSLSLLQGTSSTQGLTQVSCIAGGFFIS